MIAFLKFLGSKCTASHTAAQGNTIKKYFSSTVLYRWPSSDLALHGTGDCYPDLTGAQCLQFHREQSAIVEVYFEQLNYESLQESEAYGASYIQMTVSESSTSPIVTEFAF